MLHKYCIVFSENLWKRDTQFCRFVLSAHKFYTTHYTAKVTVSYCYYISPFSDMNTHSNLHDAWPVAQIKSMPNQDNTPTACGPIQVYWHTYSLYVGPYKRTDTPPTAYGPIQVYWQNMSAFWHNSEFMSVCFTTCLLVLLCNPKTNLWVCHRKT